MRLEKWTRRISRGFMQFYGFMYHGKMVESSKLMHCFYHIRGFKKSPCDLEKNLEPAFGERYKG